MVNVLLTEYPFPKPTKRCMYPKAGIDPLVYKSRTVSEGAGSKKTYLTTRWTLQVMPHQKLFGSKTCHKSMRKRIINLKGLNQEGYEIAVVVNMSFIHGRQTA